MDYQKYNEKRHISPIPNDKYIIQNLQRQCKKMENILLKKHPDSVSALIVASKQLPLENETKALLENRISYLESELKSTEDAYRRNMLDFHTKLKSMRDNYEIQIEELEQNVAILKCSNSEINAKASSIEFKESSTQTECKTASTAVQTALSVKIKSSSNGNVTFKEDQYLMAMVRGLNGELLQKERDFVRVTKQLDEVKRNLSKVQQKSRELLFAPVDKTQNRKLSAKSKPKLSKSYSEIIVKEKEKEKIDADTKNMQFKLDNLQKDYEKLKKKRIDDLMELQKAHEKELLNVNKKVIPLEKDVVLLNSTVDTLHNQIESMEDKFETLMKERDSLKQRVEQNEEIEECIEDHLEFNEAD